MKTTRFTLIELLVVVAIIAILASMLLPVLAGVRYKARLVQCMNNQKQLVAAVHMYANDSQDALVPYDPDGSYSVPQPNATRTFWESSTVSSRSNFAILFHEGYFTTGDILYCPTQTHPGWMLATYAPFPTPASPPDTGWSQRVRVGYHYNPWRSNPSGGAARYTKLNHIDEDSVLSVDMMTQVVLLPSAAPHKNYPSITYSRGDGSVTTNRSSATYALVRTMNDNFTPWYNLLQSLTTTE